MANSQFTRNFETGSGQTYPRFFMDSIVDQLATEQQGRPIYKEVERVQILMPANRLLAPVENVNDGHRQLWPKEYAAFKEGHEISPEGTPLEQWNILNKAQVYELKGMHLRTVEDVAKIPDNVAQTIPFGLRLRESAAAYLDDAAASALTTRLGAENDRLKSDIALLQRQNEEMKASVDQMWAEMQAMKNAPNPLLSTPPMMHDPSELAKMGRHVEAPPSSAFENFAPRPRRGRPPRQPEAA